MPVFAERHVEVIGLRRRGDDIVALGGDPLAGFHRLPADQIAIVLVDATAMRGFFPGAGDLALRGEEVLHPAQERRLQRRHALDAQLLAHRVGLGRGRPGIGRHLVGADMEIGRREEVYHLAEDGLDHVVDRLDRRVEAIVGERLDRVVEPVLARIAELRQRLDHGVAMARHIDLRNDLDAEILAHRDDVADGVLGVIAAGFIRRRAEQRRHRLAMTAPGGDLRQLRIGLDLDPPSLVVREVPVQHVELVPGQDSDELLDLLAREEPPRHVEVAAAPAHGRLVFDATRGRERETLRMEPRAALDLPERDEPVEEASVSAAGNLRAAG